MPVSTKAPDSPRRRRDVQRPLHSVLLVAGVIAAAIVGWKGHWQARPAAPVHCDEAVLRAYREYSPRLITSSPTADRFVTRHKLGCCDECETLRVQASDSGSVIRSMHTPGSVLRATWSPDGKMIAYFHQPTGETARRLLVWHIDTDRHQALDAQPSYAQPVVRWSPDSSMVAFVDENQSLIVAKLAGPPGRRGRPDQCL